ncbi:uncharacterized protein LOC105691078 isoform X2 [Athalia rosae]|uniref:uncharacterized protein LOC105691078 isoform X2 n=1 Tax=Athalia rosae TaxID=37344 RepID=UPI0020341E31|nr:uncharacterized protein LOC105691078 isoform X2 [Athalia rosae]
MRNVEIKARVQDKDAIILRAKYLSKSKETVINQHDTFFKVSRGRLKLRQFEDGSGELIFYDRPDTEGPKISDYVKTTISSKEVQGLTDVLAKSNGIIGAVKKVRLLYIIGQTRVHIDVVEGLGNFMELEVVLNDDQSLEYGQGIAEKLMSELGVQKKDCISGAYLDMIVKNI